MKALNHDIIYRNARSKSEETFSQYRIFGGADKIREINDYDAEFFIKILQAIDLNICKLRRIDICCDHSEDLMALISEDIKKKRVTTNCGQIRGIGTLDGNPLLDE